MVDSSIISICLLQILSTCCGSITKSHLIVAADDWRPFFEVNIDSQNITYNGVMFQLLEFVQKSLNFTYEIRQPSDGQWGFVNNNGTVTGMVGMVSRNEVDFALGPFALTPERKSVVDYSNNVYVDNTVFIIGLSIGDDPWALLRPYELEVWLGIILVALISWCSAAIIDTIYTRKVKWGSLAILTYGVMFNQVTRASQQTRWYKKLHYITWVWGCLIFTKCYSDNLAALLTKPNDPPLIRAIEDVVRGMNSIKFGFEKGTANEMLGRNDAPGSTMRYSG